MSDVDLENLTGTCANCGPVNVQLRQPNRWLCMRARQAHRDAEMERQYGLTSDGFHALLIAQSGRCAICRSELHQPCIDHDHECCPERKMSCGACIRGLLCPPCNLGLGSFRDNPAALRSAAAYLENDERPA